MLTLLYAPDGTSSWTGAGVLTLCNTSRSLAELEVRFNHRRLLQSEPGFGAAATAFFDNQNQSNSLTLKVRRGVDFASIAFALQQPASFPTTGTLQIKLQGVATNLTL